MAEKKNRLEVLRNLLKTHSFDSQEKVLTALRSQGFTLAQPTLSRDLRTLKVSKVCTENGSYVYLLPESAGSNPKLQKVPLGFKSLSFSGNIAVIKTHNGFAPGLAAEIDNMSNNCILGTVAGDDTLFVVLRAGSSNEVVLDALREIIPHFDSFTY